MRSDGGYIALSAPARSPLQSCRAWPAYLTLVRRRFVVIHGTDTMAYTASALSFMLENLGKLVVITGSMLPLTDPYTDAKSNLVPPLLNFAPHRSFRHTFPFFFQGTLCRHANRRASRADLRNSIRVTSGRAIGTCVLATESDTT